MERAFNPDPSSRELEISKILFECFGPDPQVPEETSLHYDVDAALLHSMLSANPSEEHLLDYLGVQEPGADRERIGVAIERLLILARQRDTHP